jgi:FtsZ-binding cell division protein ZapB
MAEELSKKVMSDADKLMHLSLLLKALDDLEQELTEFKTENKARREALQGELSKLRWEVLSGQERLPLAGD